ncbi:MAG: hypothetical protein H7326_01745 [Bdellovibrionaceae bacterium]|nr:hypothetical protein [Pseudobdellovibrionaceae bacterium]
MLQKKFVLSCVFAVVIIIAIGTVSVMKYQEGSPGTAAAGAGLIVLVFIGWIDLIRTFAHTKRIGKIWPKH